MLDTRQAHLGLIAGVVGLASLVAPPQARAATSPPLDLRALQQALAAYQIQPVSPPVPATDFTLPDLNGHDVALSDSRGHWLLLSFFATWCGPCAAELPTLEQLYQATYAKGLNILGVAVDGTAANVGAFTRSKGVTFPVVIDQNSQASSIYHASSIPLAYLITPDGRVVGVAQGARNWSNAAALVDTLERLAKGQKGLPSQYQTAAAPVKLPPGVAPPTATASLAGTAANAAGVSANTPFGVDVQVHWEGTLRDYVLLPPKLHLPAGVRQLGTSASSSSTTGTAQISYHYRLQAAKPGRYAIDPIDLRYTPRGASSPATSRIQGPTVHVRRSVLARLPAWAWGCVAGVLLLALLGFVSWRRRSDAGDTAEPAEASDYQQLRATFEAARKKRIDGDIGGFVADLAGIEAKLGRGGDDAALAAMIEQVRYGGQVPSPSELDPLERRVERAIQELQPNTDAQERARIALADGDGGR